MVGANIKKKRIDVKICVFLFVYNFKLNLKKIPKLIANMN